MVLKKFFSGFCMDPTYVLLLVKNSITKQQSLWLFQRQCIVYPSTWIFHTIKNIMELEVWENNLIKIVHIILQWALLVHRIFGYINEALRRNKKRKIVLWKMPKFNSLRPFVLTDSTQGLQISDEGSHSVLVHFHCSCSYLDNLTYSNFAIIQIFMIKHMTTKKLGSCLLFWGLM